MNDTAAKKMLRATLAASFSKTRFAGLLKNLLNTFDERKAFHLRGNYIPEMYKAVVRSYQRIGTYTDPAGKKIDLLVVYLQPGKSADTARTALRNFTAAHLKRRNDKEAALVAFVPSEPDDWRFSFVKMEYKIDTARANPREHITPARRYSFLVGTTENNHTAQSRLLPLLRDDDTAPTLADLESAFSVEQVTEEFFDQYRALFVKILAALDTITQTDKKIRADFADKGINNTDFVKKLLGQIVFLYFLQKKGWFGVKRGAEWGSGSKDFLRELFAKKRDEQNFFNDILEPLFYKALRSWREHDYYSRFDCKIPFLNGGLFDPINGYDWVGTDILLPDELFYNDTPTASGDTGDGVFNIFDRYNFTVKEDEPLEKEVAVDPEMLGKVFEKLLPIKNRKAKGAYYTPREIVHYMCQESLATHLTTEFAGRLATADIEKLIMHGETMLEHDSRVMAQGRETDRYPFLLPKKVRDNAREIDEKLATIRVCDPAVGSGAFIVGMMTEIVKARNVLTVYLGESKERTPYTFKRNAIQNCLYGVDIDAGAVEIAMLRLWLSLVVDEQQRQTIQPLPNLNYKIVVGDSLLAGNKNVFNSQLFADAEDLKRQFGNETNAVKKQEYIQQFDAIIKQITGGDTKFYFEIHFSEVFDSKNGFDIVIGNPPYVQLQKDGGTLANRYRDQGFKTFVRTGDIYCLFYEKGLQIAAADGVMCYITSNKWMRTGYGKNLRRFLSGKNPLKLLDLGPGIFTATVDTNILMVENRNNQTQLNAVTLAADFRPGNNIADYFNQNKSLISNLSENTWSIGNTAELALKEKIEKIGTPLKQWNVKINFGIKTGYNAAFIIDKAKRKELVGADKNSAKIIKPFLRGRNISRYQCATDEWLVDTHNGYTESPGKRIPAVDVSLYPAIRDHLDEHFPALERRQDQGTTPYNLRSCAYYAEFLQEKILWPDISSENSFVWDDTGMLMNNTCYFMTGADKFLLGFLNSKLAFWYFKSFIGVDLGEDGLRWMTYYVEKIPAPTVEGKRRPLAQKIATLAEQITKAKKQNPHADTTATETKIDHLVYQLYTLTPAEIQIIEASR